MKKSPHTHILIQGARTHNLKNISLDIPKNKIVVITGPSGSGKTSLAFHTLFSEGKRRYIESLSLHARQFLGVAEKPDVDKISGLLPPIAVEQRTTQHSPRSTVGTLTEIHDHLRLLFSRVGIPQCPEHKLDLCCHSVTQIIDEIETNHDQEKLFILSPQKWPQNVAQKDVLAHFIQKGFIRFMIDNITYNAHELDAVPLTQSASFFIVVDRLRVEKTHHERLMDSIELALSLSQGKMSCCYPEQGKYIPYTTLYSCPHCHYRLEKLNPTLFSFNHPHGACPSCRGLGYQNHFSIEKLVVYPQLSLKNGALPLLLRSYPEELNHALSVAQNHKIDTNKNFELLTEEERSLLFYGTKEPPLYKGLVGFLNERYAQKLFSREKEELDKHRTVSLCPHCQGCKINEKAQNVKINKLGIHEITSQSLSNTYTWINTLNLSGYRKEIAKKISLEIKKRLDFLIAVGVGYLTLDRPSSSLSGGETQRIKLASHIGSHLTGILYVLDEPSIGLHPRDHEKLLKVLEKLRDLGNSVLVIEHDEETIRRADYVIDMGPLAGIHGGTIMAQGTLQNILDSDSLTAGYLTKKIKMPRPTDRKTPREKRSILLKGASGNNLKNIDVAIPIGLLTCITGVSGSGKSTLINDTLFRAVSKKLEQNSKTASPSPYRSLSGVSWIDRIINITQSGIARKSHSTIASYIGLLPLVRELLAATPLARQRAYPPGRFSFNNKGGRCTQCSGEGSISVDMFFLPNMYVTCDICQGKRFNRETLEICYKEKNITDILHLSVDEACGFFEFHQFIEKKLSTLQKVGLGYVSLGQSTKTLSGGEAQKLKLAHELCRQDTGKTLYILDEPTTGLHFYDIHQLLNVLLELRSQNNTIVVIEHNIDVIQAADWVIDLGPEEGEKGGTIVAFGTPEDVANNKNSATGLFLKKILHPTHS